MHPHAYRDRETILCQVDAWLRYRNIMPSCAPLWTWMWFTLKLVTFCHGWVMWLHAYFMLMFSQDCNCAGCAAVGSVYCAVQWFTTIKMGLFRAWLGCWVHNPILPWKWLWVLWLWVPNLSYALSMIDQYSPQLTMGTKKGNSYWAKDTLEGLELSGEALARQQPPGGLWSFLLTHTSLGVTSWLFSLLRLQYAL